MRALRKRSMRNNLTVQTGAGKGRERISKSFWRLMDDKASSVQMGIRETLRGYFDDISLYLRGISVQFWNPAEGYFALSAIQRMQGFSCRLICCVAVIFREGWLYRRVD